MAYANENEVHENVKSISNITRYARNEAIKSVKPGQKFSSIGNTIESIANANNYTVVREFNGHGVSNSQLHVNPPVLH